MNATRCFCCGRQLASCFRDRPDDVAADNEWPATIFEAAGNFGSTIFDPAPNEQPAALKIRICDMCVLNNRAAIDVVGEPLPESVGEDAAEYLSTAPRVFIRRGELRVAPIKSTAAGR